MKILRAKSSVFSISFTRKLALIFIVIVIAISAPIQMAKRVGADQYDDKIAALKQDIASYNAQAALLAEQSSTLQSAVSSLQYQAAIIQGQINISQAKYDQLVIQIADTEVQIKNNQDALGKTIANMYVEDQVSPIEMLASSNNIGDYLDKQEYRSSVRSQLSSTISTIKDLKKRLETQKVEAERTLSDQTGQHVALVAKQTEQQQLLSQTQGEEATYQRLTLENNAEINQLRIKQAAELAARARSQGGSYSSSPGDGSKGGYPSAWMNAPIDAYVDDWGMLTRECVSYVAFKVESTYHNMPYWGGYGNANQWVNNARNIGIKTSSVPAAGTVGVITSGTYGHVAWVESVNSNGTINISQFNVSWSGDYSEWYNVDPSFFDAYIYFGG